MMEKNPGGINTSPFRMKATRAKTRMKATRAKTPRQKLTQQQMMGAQRRASGNKAPRGR